MREHVTPRGGQEVNFLQAVQLQLVKLLLAALHVDLNLPELLQLFESVRVKLCAHIFHPEERSPVLSPSLLHGVDGPPGVLDGSEPEGVHLLVESDKRHSNCQSLLPGVTHRLPGRHHHLPRPGPVGLPVLLQEAAQSVLLPSKEADSVLVELHQSLEATCRLVD